MILYPLGDTAITTDPDDLPGHTCKHGEGKCERCLIEDAGIDIGDACDDTWCGDVKEGEWCRLHMLIRWDCTCPFPDPEPDEVDTECAKHGPGKVVAARWTDGYEPDLYVFGASDGGGDAFDIGGGGCVVVGNGIILQRNSKGMLTAPSDGPLTTNRYRMARDPDLGAMWLPPRYEQDEDHIYAEEVTHE